MLPSQQRLRRSADFQAVTKNGRRRKAGGLVAYLLPAERSTTNEVGASATPCARAGLIVGKSVGNSVVRHRVSRRLREQLRAEVSALSAGDRLVVRALPGAADRSSAQISRDLGEALRGLRRSRT